MIFYEIVKKLNTVSIFKCFGRKPFIYVTTPNLPETMPKPEYWIYFYCLVCMHYQQVSHKMIFYQNVKYLVPVSVLYTFWKKIFISLTTLKLGRNDAKTYGY